MNYKIVQDEEILKDFINWLPELTEDETYYICLFARSKYFAGLKADKSQLKRLTSDKHRMFAKIKQLECEVGSYTQGPTNIVIPQEALAIYITPNPRSNSKAAQNSLKKLVDLAIGHSKNYNLHQEVMSQIQKAKSRSVFRDFDFDDVKYVDIAHELEDVINPEAFHILDTRGGFHMLIELSKINSKYENKWFMKLKNVHNQYSSDTENHGDNLIPIPGCTQGGYVPTLHHNDSELEVFEKKIG